MAKKNCFIFALFANMHLLSSLPPILQEKQAFGFHQFCPPVVTKASAEIIQKENISGSCQGQFKA